MEAGKAVGFSTSQSWVSSDAAVGVGATWGLGNMLGGPSSIGVKTVFVFPSARTFGVGSSNYLSESYALTTPDRVEILALASVTRRFGF
jgi:hypothetical protein